MINKIISVFLIIFYNSIFSQIFNLSGNLEPGNLIIGNGENIVAVKLNNNPIDVDEFGNFVFGFDRDDKGTHILTIEFTNKTIVKKIKLSKRKYNIQKINKMDEKLVTAPKEEMERIEREREISKQARAKVGDEKSALYLNGFIRPIEGGRISSVFGSQRILNGTPKSPHNGIDIAVPKGTPVKAMTDGIVRLSADNFYYSGNYILLDHGQGLNSVYLHLDTSYVKEGQKVAKGEIIGKVGTTGRSTGPHLHWGVQWFNKRIDPLTLLEIKEIL